MIVLLFLVILCILIQSSLILFIFVGFNFHPTFVLHQYLASMTIRSFPVCDSYNSDAGKPLNEDALDDWSELNDAIWVCAKSIVIRAGVHHTPFVR